MGTNFYWLIPIIPPHTVTLPTGVMRQYGGSSIVDDDPEIHIGKRSAAGAWCWDCGVTLCMGGSDRIHYGDDYHKACPKCGAEPIKETLDDSSAGVELGFAKATMKKKHGVRSCSSFSWAQDPEAVRRACEAHIDEEIVTDEYGRLYTGGGFLVMLNANCPVQFTRSIGQWFS